MDTVVEKYDYCRIGSLEKRLPYQRSKKEDYCRIGSLENEEIQGLPLRPDYCRIGSLETAQKDRGNVIM